jgi:hypothetical protein
MEFSMNRKERKKRKEKDIGEKKRKEKDIVRIIITAAYAVIDR